MDLPDIPYTPQSPEASDITVLRLELFFYIWRYFDFVMHNIFFLMVTFLFLARPVPPLPTGVSPHGYTPGTHRTNLASMSSLTPTREKGHIPRPHHRPVTALVMKFVFPLPGRRGSPALLSTVDVSSATRRGATMQ